jgi:hypothetical protein
LGFYHVLENSHEFVPQRATAEKRVGGINEALEQVIEPEERGLQADDVTGELLSDNLRCRPVPRAHVGSSSKHPCRK